LFDPINPKFQPGNRIINNFSNHISFHLFSKHNNLTFKNHIQQLDTLAIKSSNTPPDTLVVMDASIKNNITVSIAHIHVHDKPLIKTLYHTINVTSSEAKFLTIRCGINQADILYEISKIIVVMDSIHAVKKIFDLLLYMLQKQVAFILEDFRGFFNYHHKNIIEFWECPSKINWKLYQNIDNKMKLFNLAPMLPNKNFWDFSKKSECNDIISKWKMTFQASDSKERNFLDLVNNDDNILELTYSKGGT